jgi:hypothetical protein
VTLNNPAGSRRHHTGECGSSLPFCEQCHSSACRATARLAGASFLYGVIRRSLRNCRNFARFSRKDYESLGASVLNLSRISNNHTKNESLFPNRV